MQLNGKVVVARRLGDRAVWVNGCGGGGRFKKTPFKQQKTFKTQEPTQNTVNWTICSTGLVFMERFHVPT